MLRITGKAMFIIACLTAFNSTLALCQKDNIGCQLMLNQVDNLLAAKDTLSAIVLYEAINEEVCNVKYRRYGHLSRVYYQYGLIEKSKTLIEKAVQHGLLGGMHFGYVSEDLLLEIANKYGDSFLSEMKSLNKEISASKLMLYGPIINELHDVFVKDQELRRNNIYKECRRYDFDYRMGNLDTLSMYHEQMMECARDFRQKDSLLLLNFVRTVDSIGYVPGDDILFGMFPIEPVINHTSHFLFSGLDSLYLRSVKAGTLSPRVYAWYKGYNEEYFHKTHLYYFTHWADKFSNFSEKEVEKINTERLKIGLPICPAVVWNVILY